VVFIRSHMPFIFNSNSEDRIKIRWFLMKLWINVGVFYLRTLYTYGHLHSTDIRCVYTVFCSLFLSSSVWDVSRFFCGYSLLLCIIRPSDRTLPLYPRSPCSSLLFLRCSLRPTSLPQPPAVRRQSLFRGAFVSPYYCPFHPTLENVKKIEQCVGISPTCTVKLKSITLLVTIS